MATHKNIEAEIEHALQSMDDHTRASPQPYLETRIYARLSLPKAPNVWDTLYTLITKPAVAFAGIAFILSLNILMITSKSDSESLKFRADSNGDWQGYTTTATSALYDLENMEP